MIKLKQISDAGSAAALDAGTSAGDLVQLDSQGRLPAVDGSLITGLSGGGSGGTSIRPVVSADITTAAYQIGASLDCGSVIVVNNSSSVTRDVYLPAANSYSAGFYLFVARDGGTAYPATLKPYPSSSDTINRSVASVTLGAYDCQKLVTDGSSTWILISQGRF